MPLTPNVRRQLEDLLATEGNFSGQIVLHCRGGSVFELELHRKIRPAPENQEVVDLHEVARRRGG